MRLLHARHADHARRNCLRPAACRAARRSASTLRQLLPLHRLSGDRRRDRSASLQARAEEQDAMKIPPRLCRPALTRARPAELLYRPLGAAAESGATDARARPICQRHRAAAHGACRLRALAARACAHQKHRRPTAAKKAPGVIAVVTGAELAQSDHALGRRAHASEGHQIGAAACHRRRARLLAGRSGLRRGRAHARRSGGRLRAGRGRYEPLPAVTDAETALDPATPVIHPELGDNLTFERKLEAGDPDQGFRRSRRGRRGDLRVRPPHRRHQRAARHRRRLESAASSASPSIRARRRRT